MFFLQPLPSIITNSLKPHSANRLVSSFESIECAFAFFLDPRLVLCHKLGEHPLSLRDRSPFRSLEPVARRLDLRRSNRLDLLRQKHIPNAFCRWLEGAPFIIDENG